MRRAPTNLIAAALAGVVLSACSATPTPTATASTSPFDRSDADLVARGEYLVRIAGCNDCHTPGYGERGGAVPTRDWLVGSPMGFNGPWGTTFPSNLRLKAQEMDEAGWLAYTGRLHTRPMMPDYNVRAMTEDDRRALYRFIHGLGSAGQKAPDYLPPGQAPTPPYLQMVLPPAPPAGA